MVPPALEHFGKKQWLKTFYRSLFVILSLGIVLPTMHQSGLGAIIVVAGDKISPLWQTSWISLIFLMSAILMGFAIVIFEGALTVLGMGRRLELHLYHRLANVLRWFLLAYLLIRFGDLIYRDALGAVFETPTRGIMFVIENALFVVPLIILLHPRWQGGARLLFLAATCLLLGGAVLRFDAFIVGFNPPAGYTYFPSVVEIFVSIGLIAVEIVGFTYIVKRYPILPPRKKTVAPNSVRPAPNAAANA
jgi:Ni/Fe-hydrogenase subunit HybB-like protein